MKNNQFKYIEKNIFFFWNCANITQSRNNYIQPLGTLARHIVLHLYYNIKHNCYFQKKKKFKLDEEKLLQQ